MSITAIIDYGMCNLDSVARAVEECGGTPLVTDQAKDLGRAARIILPGVGAFPEAMNNIRKRSFEEALQEQVIHRQIPLLGICLGMQLLAEKGTEIEEINGLGLIAGEIRRLEANEQDTRLPHIGWNEVHFVKESILFRGVDTGRDFYFVHSYHFCPENESDKLAWTPYSNGFASAVQKQQIFGVQFHPEKSQRLGFQVLKNFLKV